MFTLKCLLLCCLIATAFADDDAASTSPIVWVLFALLFLIMAAMTIAMLFIAYHFHQRFKKIEFRFSSRRASVSSERYSKGSDSRRSSKRSITSNGRYDNNPIRKRQSRSPRNSPQPDSGQQQNHNGNDHLAIPMDVIYHNLQDPQQHPQIFYTPNNALGHYETLAMYANNGSAVEDDVKEEELQQQQQQEDETFMTDDQYNQQKADNSDCQNDDVPIVEASYITQCPDNSRTAMRTISDGDNQGLVYSDVINPSPPTPSKNEHKKVNSVRKGKRPESSEEYTDPMHNGVLNMKRLKASSVISKTADTAEANSSKERHSSESAAGGAHRKDFEEWPIKAQGANAAPAHESDL